MKNSLKFYEKLNKIEEEIKENKDLKHVVRRGKALLKYREVVEELFGEDKHSFYSGRPDIIFEHYDGNSGIEKVEVGEVKYTDKKQTFKQGLEELIEYMYYARKGSEYLKEENKVEGVLVVDDVECFDGLNNEDDISVRDSNYF